MKSGKDIKNFSRRGRKRNTYDGMLSDRQITYALNVLHYLHYKKGKSLRYLHTSISKFAEDEMELILTKYSHIKVEKHDFKPSINTLKGDIHPTRDLKKSRMNAYFIWVQEVALKKYDIETYVDPKDKTDLPINVEKLCDIFGIDKSKVNKDLNLLVGTYCLYRPCHENPKNMVALAKLVIDSKNGGYCNYKSRRKQSFIVGENKIEKIDETIAEGEIAFVDQKFFMVLRTSQNLPMIIIADEIKIPFNRDENFSEFKGVITPMLTTFVSSWPFFAMRLTDEEAKDFIPETIEYTKKEDFPDRFSQVRDYGFINWRATKD